MNLFRRLNLLQSFALVGALTVSVGIAHATTITYNLVGVETSAGSVTGTVTINTTTDLVTAADITFNDATVGDPVFTNITPNGYTPSSYNGLGQDYISVTNYGPVNWGGQIALYYDTANIGTGDLSICLYDTACGTMSDQASFVQAYVNNGQGGPFDITSGSLNPVSSVAPEPSSLVLLGTGLLVIAGLVGRRYLRA